MQYILQNGSKKHNSLNLSLTLSQVGLKALKLKLSERDQKNIKVPIKALNRQT